MAKSKIWFVVFVIGLMFLVSASPAMYSSALVAKRGTLFLQMEARTATLPSSWGSGCFGQYSNMTWVKLPCASPSNLPPGFTAMGPAPLTEAANSSLRSNQVAWVFCNADPRYFLLVSCQRVPLFLREFVYHFFPLIPTCSPRQNKEGT